MVKRMSSRQGRTSQIVCRLVHDGLYGTPIGRLLYLRRAPNVVWLDNGHALEFEALGHDAVIALEAGCIAGEEFSAGIGDPDLELDPPAIDRALWRLPMPVIRFCAYYERSPAARKSSSPLAQVCAAGSSAMVRFSDRPPWSRSDSALAGLIVGLANSRKRNLEEEEIASWMGCSSSFAGLRRLVWK